LVTTTGFLNMAKESVEIGELDELLGLLDRAEAAAERMDGLISGILDLATDAKETVQEPIELDAAVDDALENLHDAISGKGIEIRRDAPIGVALGDRRYVAQVFDNLLGNALKYGQPTDPRARPIIEIRAELRGEVLRVSVGDNGPGIAPDEMGAVLARAADAEQGALTRRAGAPPTTGGNIGLGLGLVRQAMNECGGTLSLRSSSLGGAEFVLDFQLAPCAIAPTPTTSQAPLPAQHSRRSAASEPQTRIPERLTRELLSSHSCSSSRMMLTTG
ncbi:MAG: HAMP domain-containing sensor histidine kinase, partial [Planctomycetota bacterium]